jgi:hypothetical protein
MAIRVVDRAIQSFGAEGVCQDTFLARAAAGLRTLRLADVGVNRYLSIFFPAHRLL